MGNAINSHLETAEKTGVCQLSSLKLSEVPPKLLLLTKNLRTLDLSNNKIQLLPGAIGNFSVLKSLNLNNNNLSALCSEICKLKKLETLTVESNKLKTVPLQIDQCTALKTVSLRSNNLRLFPAQFSKLKHLISLDLSENSITEIPNNLQDLQVVELNLNRNEITNIPEALALCPHLKVLRFEENCVPKEGVPSQILTDSGISLLAYTGNLFSDKDFQNLLGYDKYMERFTATRKKFD